MLPEAQWPATGAKSNVPSFATVAAVRAGPPVGGLSTATIAVRGLNQAPGAWVGATIRIAPGQQWVFQAGTVIASAPGSLTFTYQQLQPAQYLMISTGDRFYLTGSPAALGAPGQWYRDPSTGVLSLRPSRGNGAAGHFEAKHRLYAFDLSGRSYLNIMGLHLFACTINTDAGPRGERILQPDRSPRLTVRQPTPRRLPTAGPLNRNRRGADHPVHHRRLSRQGP